jgi:hypothetical protein
MNSKNGNDTRTGSATKTQEQKPRFQIFKLEERIAPGSHSAQAPVHHTECHRCAGTAQTGRF